VERRLKFSADLQDKRRINAPNWRPNLFQQSSATAGLFLWHGWQRSSLRADDRFGKDYRGLDSRSNGLEISENRLVKRQKNQQLTPWFRQCDA
jgi:hypothetical protein